MTTWHPERRRYAGAAILTTLATAASALFLGGGTAVFGASMYTLFGVVALLFPAGITAQVLAGQVMAASVLVGGSAMPALAVAPVFAGVVATAELLSVVARLDSPVRCEPGDAAARGALAASAALGGFMAVALVTGIPGPGGFLAVLLASGACVVAGAGLTPDAR